MCSAASCACLTCSKWWHATCIISALVYLAPPVVVSTTLSDAIASGQVKPNERDDRECHIGKTLTVAVCGVQQGIVQSCRKASFNKSLFGGSSQRNQSSRSTEHLPRGQQFWEVGHEIVLFALCFEICFVGGFHSPLETMSFGKIRTKHTLEKDIKRFYCQRVRDVASKRTLQADSLYAVCMTSLAYLTQMLVLGCCWDLGHLQTPRIQ